MRKRVTGEWSYKHPNSRMLVKIFFRLRSWIMLTIAAGLRLPFLAMKYATSPETCGHAIDVPDLVSVDCHRKSVDVVPLSVDTF